MRVLVAPDKFRGTLTAAEAARAITTGWRRARPQDELLELPMADGGEGTLDALMEALGGSTRTARVEGPLGDPVDAAFGLAEGPEGRTGVVEMARASGLALSSRRDPLRASTYGTGELIRAAAEAGASRLIVCIGGSATTDGGAGMAQAIGARLDDARGRPISRGGVGLLDLARVALETMVPQVRSAQVLAASDVDNPLTGPRGAAHVFGPQKGASEQDVLVLDRALGHFAAVLHRDLAVDVREIRGGGAAGGLGAGLVAFLGARIRPGVVVVMQAIGFAGRLEACDLVVTGEGRLDETSMSGKVVGGVLGAARERERPVAIVCGEATVAPEGVEVVSLVERVGRARALGEARSVLVEVAEELAGHARSLSSPP